MIGEVDESDAWPFYDFAAETFGPPVSCSSRAGDAVVVAFKGATLKLAMLEPGFRATLLSEKTMTDPYAASEALVDEGGRRIDWIAAPALEEGTDGLRRRTWTDARGTASYSLVYRGTQLIGLEEDSAI